MAAASSRLRREARQEGVSLTTPAAASAALLFQRGGECGNDLEEVANDTVVRHLEDRRLTVLVDGDDGLRPFHADQVLNRAGNAEREIQLRGDGLARAADLAV